MIEVDRAVRADGFGIRIGEVTLRAPDGSLHERRYLHTPDAVAIVAVDAGELVLVREFRAAVGREVVQVPMGKIGAGQDPMDAARAELAEETGFSAARWTPTGALLSCPGWLNQTLHVFRADELTALPAPVASDDPQDIEEQHITLVRVPVTEFRSAVRSGLIVDARTIAAVHLSLT